MKPGFSPQAPTSSLPLPSCLPSQLLQQLVSCTATSTSTPTSQPEANKSHLTAFAAFTIHSPHMFSSTKFSNTPLARALTLHLPPPRTSSTFSKLPFSFHNTLTTMNTSEGYTSMRVARAPTSPSSPLLSALSCEVTVPYTYTLTPTTRITFPHLTHPPLTQLKTQSDNSRSHVTSQTSSPSAPA